MTCTYVRNETHHYVPIVAPRSSVGAHGVREPHVKVDTWRSWDALRGRKMVP